MVYSGMKRKRVAVIKSAKFIIGLISGLLGGFFGGLLGLGGGIIMIPLMTWLAKMTQHQAHGTSLVAIVFTAIVGAATYYLLGGVDWKIALILAVSATITARFGARYAHSLPEKKLKMAFGFFPHIRINHACSKRLLAQDKLGFWALDQHHRVSHDWICHWFRVRYDGGWWGRRDGATYGNSW